MSAMLFAAMLFAMSSEVQQHYNILDRSPQGWVCATYETLGKPAWIKHCCGRRTYANQSETLVQ